MKKAGIRVATINGTVKREIRQVIMDDLKCGHPSTRLLYVTPEFCAHDYLRNVLRLVHKQRELARIVVDEAHCISEWGHDFRPSFKALDFFKRTFPDVPVLCCTATATRRVRDDIIETLALDPQKVKVFTMSTSRPNLHYEVRFKSDEDDHYDNFLVWIRATHKRRAQNAARAAELAARAERASNVSGIIYTLYRKDCEILASRLAADGIGAKPYHAGLSNAEKDDHLHGWVANKEGYDVIVATTAFGMGIDKENVRFVVHWQIPKSFEGFYQEAGRAGRDGKASICILYYSREDRDRAASLMAREQSRKQSAKGNHGGGVDASWRNRAESLQALVNYCENVKSCRHALIAGYFGDSGTPECDWACDWHKDASALAKRKEDGLASEEWCATQRQTGGYEYDDYDYE